MSNRHNSRSAALQVLYEWDFHGQSPELSELVDELLLVDNRYTTDVDKEFVLRLVTGVKANLQELDGVIAKQAPEWPLEQVSLVDRNLLRLGLFELLKDKSVPPKVVINEAVELGKSFGGDRSAKFVNGVLGGVFTSLVEKSETSPQKEESVI